MHQYSTLMHILGNWLITLITNSSMDKMHKKKLPTTDTDSVLFTLEEHVVLQS